MARVNPIEIDCSGHARLALHNPMKFLLRSTAFMALKRRLGEMLPGNARQRVLEMPVLETHRLVLRKFDSGDLTGVIAWEEASAAQGREVEAQEFLEYCFREYRERGIGPWAMQLKATGVVAGNC